MKRRREGSLRSRAWSSLSHRLVLKAAPKVQNNLWVSREAARKKRALVPGGKGRQAGLSAGQIWYGMVCRKVCLSNAPARHPVRGRFLRASRIEANGSSRLERTPALSKKKFAQDAEWASVPTLPPARGRVTRFLSRKLPVRKRCRLRSSKTKTRG